MLPASLWPCRGGRPPKSWRGSWRLHPHNEPVATHRRPGVNLDETQHLHDARLTEVRCCSILLSVALQERSEVAMAKKRKSKTDARRSNHARRAFLKAVAVVPPAAVSLLVDRKLKAAKAQ